MSQFPTAGHLLSRAGLVPRLDESAGTGLSQGAPFLTRVDRRRGPKKALIAVAASILTAAYHMLTDGTFYQDLGPGHFARLNPAREAEKLAKRIRTLGLQVDIRAAA